jgi:hypothetical protein
VTKARPLPPKLASTTEVSLGETKDVPTTHTRIVGKVMPNPEVYYLFYRLPMCFKLGVVLSMLTTQITKK